MAKEGAALLSQVEGLLEQFLALPYTTPVHRDVEMTLETVRGGLRELRSMAGEPKEEGVPGDEGNSAPPRQEPREEYKDFGDARSAAMKDHERRGGFVERTERDEETDEDAKRRRRKAKA